MSDPQREGMERIQGLAKGDKGDRGARGPAGRRGLPVIQGRAVVVLFLISVAISAFAVFWVSHEVNANNAARARQARVFEAKLCFSLDQLKRWSPPAGNPRTNPSRASLQQLRRDLAPLGADVGCR